MLSVVIPTIGREDYLDTALSSLVEQKAFDEVVVYDNSPGQNLGRRSPLSRHSRVRWERSGGNLPPIQSWNGAVAACRMPWVAIFGDDDVAGPDFGSSIRDRLVQGGLIHAPFRLIDQFGREERESTAIPVSCDHNEFRYRRMMGEIYSVIPGFAFKRSDFEGVGGFRKLGLPNEIYCDDDLWFRIAARARSVSVIPIRTWSYRRHLGQVSRRFDMREFIIGLDLFVRQVEDSLLALGVPESQIFPPKIGRHGYKRYLLSLRYSQWLRQSEGTGTPFIKEILHFPIPWWRKCSWILRRARYVWAKWRNGSEAGL